MNKELKYYFGWIWNFGTLPPKGYSSHWLLSKIGRKLKKIKISNEVMGVKGNYYIELNSPKFIPANDTWRNGWFGIKRLIFKKRRILED